VLDRLGFRLEGIRRDYERKHGSFVDLMIYARLATDAATRAASMPGVRVATAADASRIAPLFDAYRQFYGLPSDRPLAQRYLAERLALGESVVLVAEATDGTPLGFVQMYPTFSSLHASRVFVLYDLYVDAAARRGGVARRLMEAAVHEARAAGAVALTLQTAKSNLAAQRLYESLGWRRDEEFREYGLTL
jgi:ribosomal protein S18 acetylase RimI-like enzyme